MGGELNLMKKYKVNGKKIIQEEIVEITIEETDDRVRRIQRDLERIDERIAHFEREKVELQAELDSLLSVLESVQDV